MIVQSATCRGRNKRKSSLICGLFSCNFGSLKSGNSVSYPLLC